MNYNYKEKKDKKCKEMKIELEKLPKGKFLLGFSGGVDSSALFFLLLREGVEFDIAIVDYGVREQSREEVEYAKALAREYDKMCHFTLSPKIESNFEAKAREVRYEFFASLVKEYKYSGVILAHQLDDRFEWSVMQFCKGAGLNTLLGFESEGEYKGIKIFRPLLNVAKSELYEYCKNFQIRYFEDSSNQEDKYLRNRFREILKPLIERHSKGIAQSFEYLQEDKRRLYESKRVNQCFGIEFWHRGESEEDIHLIDLALKKRGYILSSRQRAEIKRQKFSCEIVNFVIESSGETLFLFPKKEGKMTKIFRDFARRHQIPQRLREYLFLIGVSEDEIKEFLQKSKG